MATKDDVRRICAKLPGAIEGAERFGFSVLVKGKHQGFCWSWLERIHPKKARVINESVLAIRTPGLAAKDLLIESNPVAIFTEPHYNGYPAILVKLAEIDCSELEELLIEAWRCKAPKEAILEYDAMQNH